MMTLAHWDGCIQCGSCAIPLQLLGANPWLMLLPGGERSARAGQGGGNPQRHCFGCVTVKNSTAMGSAREGTIKAERNKGSQREERRWLALLLIVNSEQVVAVGHPMRVDLLHLGVMCPFSAAWKRRPRGARRRSCRRAGGEPRPGPDPGCATSSPLPSPWTEPARPSQALDSPTSQGSSC